MMMPRERCKDLVGRTVRLTREVERRDGVRFRRGTRMRITGTYRGRYYLEMVHPRRDRSPSHVAHVSRHEFVVEIE